MIFSSRGTIGKPFSPPRARCDSCSPQRRRSFETPCGTGLDRSLTRFVGCGLCFTVARDLRAREREGKGSFAQRTEEDCCRGPKRGAEGQILVCVILLIPPHDETCLLLCLPLCSRLFSPLCETSAAFSLLTIQRRDPPHLALVAATVPAARDEDDSSAREKEHSRRGDTEEERFPVDAV